MRFCAPVPANSWSLPLRTPEVLQQLCLCGRDCGAGRVWQAVRLEGVYLQGQPGLRTSLGAEIKLSWWVLGMKQHRRMRAQNVRVSVQLQAYFDSDSVPL